MERKSGGTRVKAGYYWHAAQWEIVTISGRDGGVLPGGPDEGYYGIPVLAMLMLAPIMGALFVVFLPFIGFAILAQYAAQAAVAAFKRQALHAGATLSPAWRPGEAYLAGKPEEKGEGTAEPKVEAKLLALEQEIESKKNGQ
jgi:hypothetical protein